MQKLTDLQVVTALFVAFESCVRIARKMLDAFHDAVHSEFRMLVEFIRTPDKSGDDLI